MAEIGLKSGSLGLGTHAYRECGYVIVRMSDSRWQFYKPTDGAPQTLVTAGGQINFLHLRNANLEDAKTLGDARATARKLWRDGAKARKSWPRSMEPPSD